MVIEDFDTRHHAFEGCFNFRDIGGYQAADGRSVRWSRYFRAGRQDRMTAEDLARVRELGITTQIDLRKPEEVHEQGRGPLESLGARYRHLPVIPDGGSDRLNQLVGDTGISGNRYLAYLEFDPKVWVKLFEVFADVQRHPVVLHCTAGKDRTGVCTAFLLTALGVDRAVIEADYALTNRDVTRQVDFIESTTGLPETVSREEMTRLAGVPSEAIGDFLDGLQARWGGALGYLDSIGVDDRTLAAVREAFLED